MDIKDIIIAIDGYSSTGKSSFAKRIASELGFLYLDSGALYRGVTLFALDCGFIRDGVIDEPALEAALPALDLHFENHGEGTQLYQGNLCIERDIRTMRVSSFVSPIATLGFVRRYVDGKLREFGRQRRVVMDGRDIGTTVFPDAELKIFMVADSAVRARRRMDELVAKGEDVQFEEILDNLSERDYIDSHRDLSPLRQAKDAVILDNTHLTPDQQMEWLLKILQTRFSK